MEEYLQEDWGNYSQEFYGYFIDQELGKKVNIYDIYLCVCVCIFIYVLVFNILNIF